MPSQSRYRSVPPGELRPIPPAEGVFRHTVRQGDRLDHLAATYYGDPLAYWRICDADPEALSPLTLLGDDPMRTTFFPLTAPAGADRAGLLRSLAATLGVRDVRPAFDGVEVVHNPRNADARAVADVIRSAGFTPGPSQDRDRVGTTVVIPPAGGA